VTGKQLKTIREKMKLKQYEFAELIKMTRNSVARMERGEMIVTPPMALLISYVARGRLALILLTDKQVAEQLQVKKRTVARLGIPFVRVGAGKGAKRYRQDDVDAYINLRVQYQRGNDGKENSANG
jgi:DNA-binding XRE family transcriptional regulator